MTCVQIDQLEDGAWRAAGDRAPRESSCCRQNVVASAFCSCIALRSHAPPHELNIHARPCPQSSATSCSAPSMSFTTRCNGTCHLWRRIGAAAHSRQHSSRVVMRSTSASQAQAGNAALRSHAAQRKRQSGKRHQCCGVQARAFCSSAGHVRGARRRKHAAVNAPPLTPAGSSVNVRAAWLRRLLSFRTSQTRLLALFASLSSRHAEANRCCAAAAAAGSCRVPPQPHARMQPLRPGIAQQRSPHGAVGHATRRHAGGAARPLRAGGSPLPQRLMARCLARRGSG